MKCPTCNSRLRKKEGRLANVLVCGKCKRNLVVPIGKTNTKPIFNYQRGVKDENRKQ